ncbi:MAG: PAS domain-containing protein [Rubrivivax sp.]|nr:PAS domain-containing protein [Rubrivivax sp.]
MKKSRPPLPARVAEPGAVVDDATWMAVIGKMDEVYSQLIADEVALEEKNAALEQSQQFIYGLLASMSDVLVAADLEGRVEQTNAALCSLVGRSDAELQGTALAALMADTASCEKLVQAQRAVLTRQDSATLEVELQGPAAPGVPVEFNCSARVDSNGRRIGHVFVGRPLGELKRAYHDLREAHEALKRTQQQLLHSEKLASLGRLVAGVAHELNNPISFLLGNVDALRKYAGRLSQYLGAVHAGPGAPALAPLRAQLRIDALLADLPSLIEGMSEGAQRTADIVSALKRFSVVDREDRAPVDMVGVVDRAIHWMKKGAAPGFRVEWLPPSGPCITNGSSGQLLQVLMNLIQNAADACAALPDGRLRIALEQEAGWLRLRFTDNGPGIPEEHLPRVFDPFFTTKPVGKGTGLGLSISYGIVEQHGGRMTVGPASGGGAEFVVDLPAA